MKFEYRCRYFHQNEYSWNCLQNVRHLISAIMCCHPQPTGGPLNIKMLSYQYTDPHVKDKTVLSLPWESPYLGKTVFILRQGPGSHFYLALWHPSPPHTELRKWESLGGNFLIKYLYFYCGQHSAVSIPALGVMAWMGGMINCGS